jgi:hypothetical protein
MRRSDAGIAECRDVPPRSKIPHYSAHDFRHRHISVLLKQGLSRAEVAAIHGHANTNEFATDEHVVVEDV